MKLCIVSGKGGTGKTTLSVALAMVLADHRGGGVALLDCDVEEPNAHLYLRPAQANCRSVTVPVPTWEAAACRACGACKEACRFGALALFGGRLEIFPEHCHACGVCVHVCPHGALHETPRVIGLLWGGQADGLVVQWGELTVGEPRPVPLIEAVRQGENTVAHVIIDGPPGTACSLVAAASGMDAALVVTEPTPFGLHDLQAALDVLEVLGVPAAVVVNKATDEDGGIDACCRSRGVPVLLRIPFDRQLAASGARAIPLHRAAPGWGKALMRLWSAVETQVRLRRSA